MSENRNVLLLPGSRNFEVQNLLPLFMKAIKSLPYKVNVAIVKSPNVHRSLFEPYLNDIQR